MPKAISILIPTHNRCGLILRTLESLSQAHIPEGVEVELIVVANACTDDTDEQVSLMAHEMPFPTRCVIESEVGLNVARNRAAREASGEVFAYLDDDVWVDKDWLLGLSEVYEMEQADIVGGRVVLWWEAVDRPPWLDEWCDTFLSSCDHGLELRLIHPSEIPDFVGANLSFLRSVYEALGGFTDGLDRKGTSLISGGDTDFIWRGQASGFRLFYSPRACVKHWVAPHRVSQRYLHGISFAIGQSEVLISPRRSTRHWVGVFLYEPPRACINICGEVVAHLQGNKRVAMSRRLSALVRLGHAAGALRLICKRASNGSAR